MKLTHLSLTNFRTYKKFQQPLAPITIFVGPNGVGKTNLLEAAYLLAVLKSYRATTDAETIRFGEEFAKIVGTIETSNSPIATRKSSSDELEIVIHKGQKKGKMNGAVKPLSQLIGTLKAVLFSPEQLDIVTGPPRRRRRFLDSLLSQVDPRYTRALLEYQQSLQQRNALLFSIRQGGASATELYFWDKRLIETSKIIHQARVDLVATLNLELPPCYRAIAATKEVLTIVPHFQELSPEILRAKLVDDIQVAATTAGLHRDNFSLQIGARELGIFGSRGEWRSALFALKSAESRFLKEETKEDPVLLLDDVFSELDPSRRERLLSGVRAGQTILTATDLGSVPAPLRTKGEVMEVAKYAQPFPA